VAVRPPANCARMKPGTSAGWIPLNVSVRQRAIVAAGLANDVEAVNQYAAAMYAPTANGTIPARRRELLQITASTPKVARTSLKSGAPPARACDDHCKGGDKNIA